MPRFQLIVREPGKAPVTVPLDRAMVVGRSRKVDVKVDDDEVGREQFRLLPEGDSIYVEGIGETNRTTVDGVVLGRGTRQILQPGMLVLVGKTQFELVGEGAPPRRAPPPADLDATMVAPGPAAAHPPAPPPPREPIDPEQEQTDDGVGPMRTMQMPRPGGGPPVPPAEPMGPMMTQAFAGPARGPGAAPGPTNRPADDDVPERTMAVPGPGRPAPGKPPVPPPPPPARGKAPAPPPASPPPPPPPPPSASPAAAPPPAAGGGAPRPTTVMLPQDLEPMPQLGTDLAPPIDLESRVHDALPRLVVKCEGMKRRVRLMKPVSTVGRAESADVLLPNESVSEIHAEIAFDGTEWRLTDRGSTNGSLVDGVQLRGGSGTLHRHSLLGLGSVRAIFLCNDRRTAARDRRHEQRAAKLLVKAGRLGDAEAREAMRIARGDAAQSLAEMLLMETPLSAAEWATAIASTAQPGLLDRLLDLFSRGKRRGARPGGP